MLTPSNRGTFLLWGLFDIIIGFGTIALAKETRGLSLEKTGQPKGFRDDNEAKPGNVYRRPSSSSIGSDNKNPAQVKDTDI